MTIVLIVVALCLATSAVIVMLARRLVERSSPSTVVPILAIGSLVNGASLGLLLTLLGVAMVGRLPEVAAAAGWSVDRLEAALPVPVTVGLLAVAAAVVLLSRVGWRAGRITAALVRSDRLSRRLRAGGAPVVILDGEDAQPDAYTIAGVTGCVVISRRLLEALGPMERRMLTGHELSHLRRRHHLYVHAVDLAVAANPAMARVADAVRLGIERWADEEAVAMVAGDRRAAAAALATTALTRAHLRRGAATRSSRRRAVPQLGVAASHVTLRAHALLAPAPGRSVVTMLLAGLLAATCAATLVSAFHIFEGFEYAEVLRRMVHK